MLKRIFIKIDRNFKEIEEWSLFIAVFIALFTAMANVILRKATNDLNLYWSDEVVRKVIYFSTYIGSVAAIRTGAQIRIDALPQMLPFLRKPLAIIAHCATLIFALILIYFGTQLTLSMFEDEYALTATLQIPEYFFYAILPLMGIMTFFRTLIAMWEDWSGQKDITKGD